MNGMIKDLTYSLRVLTRNPGFAAIAVFTLASAIGINAAIFSIVNAYLFRPLPATNPSQLVIIATKKVNFEFPYEVSYPNYQDIRQATAVFSDAIASAANSVGISVDGRPALMAALNATGSIWSPETTSRCWESTLSWAVHLGKMKAILPAALM